MHQPVRVMNALGIAGDLGADDAGGIALQLGAPHPAGGGIIDDLDMEATGGRAVGGTGVMPNLVFYLLVHAAIGPTKCRRSRAYFSGPPQQNRRAARHYAPKKPPPLAWMACPLM